MDENIRKTVNYMKRNGIRKAVGAVYERLTARYDADYIYKLPSDSELARQRETVFSKEPLISILVPAYETDEIFLSALVDCVARQSYENWELIIADASESNRVSNQIKKIKGDYAKKIKYHRLSKNKGISANSNQALQYAEGEYVGLLDHDDLLTPDALYEMVLRINELSEQGTEAKLLYSDEDKCDISGERFYEPNIKTEFNLDFLLSNNYICHFLLLKTTLAKELKFRPAYDGAQDYDLILRGVGRIKETEISYIAKVLYHWRCHEASTASNPTSKLYAYEAGRRAVQDFLKEKRIAGKVEDTEHVGFYRIIYEPDLFTARPDIGMVGGSVIDRQGRIETGMLLEDGSCPFRGIPAFFSGPANIMSVCRDVFALDARGIFLRDEDIPLFEEIMKVPYRKSREKRRKNYCNQLDEAVWRERSMELSAAIRGRGQRLLWEPSVKVRR